jgi:hypothetical protein
VVAVIDPISGLVNMVDTVLSRIDEREEKLKERLDVRDALLDLLHLVRAWADAAKATNEAFADWLSGTQPELEEFVGASLELNPALKRSWDRTRQTQALIAKEVARKLGSPSQTEETGKRKEPRARPPI